MDNAIAQKTYLTIKTEKELSRSFEDSLGLPVLIEHEKTPAKEADSIHQKLLLTGYIDSELLKITRQADTLYTAHFNLGRQFKEIIIEYNHQDFSKEDIKSIFLTSSEGQIRIPIKDLPRVIEDLTKIQSNKGRLFSKIKLNHIEKTDNNQLRALLTVSNEKIRTLDAIVIRGYEKFPQSFLKYKTGIKKGSVLNREKILKQNQILNGLRFATTTRAPEILFRQDSTIVYFYLKKENNNYFDGILGFATNEDTDKLTLNGFLDLRLSNNLNFGEEFTINYKADGNDQTAFKTKLDIPFLFNTRFGINGELQIFKKDSTFLTTTQKVQTTYQITPASKSHIGFRRITSSNLLDNQATATHIEDFNSNFFLFGGSLSKPTNNRMYSYQTEIHIDAGTGIRYRKNLKETQWNMEGSVLHNFEIGRKSSLFIQNTTAFLHSKHYLENELFRFGGINSIRGFEENSIEASFFSVLNTEYRYLLNPNIFIHSIIDIGYFENPVFKIKTGLSGIGFGLGLETNSGLFRIIFANGRRSGQKFEFSTSKIHINISSRF